MKKPLLSIGLTSYNYGKFIGEAIASILSQSYVDFELIIIDNASTDNTDDIISSFSDARIVYHKNEKNLGPHYSGNLFLTMAQGQYMHLFCADDVMLPGCLHEQMSIITEIPNIALVTCNMIISDERLNPIGTTRFFKDVCDGKQVLESCFETIRNCIGGPSNFLFRSCDGRKLSFDEKLSYIGDLDFAAQLLQFGAYANTNKLGYIYRRHSETDTNRVLGDRCRLSREWIYFIGKHSRMNFKSAILLSLKRLDSPCRKTMFSWWMKNFYNLPKIVGALVEIVAEKLVNRACANK